MKNNNQINPEKLGTFVGNIINGMPEYPTHEDIACAKEMAHMGLLDAMTDFDETTVPEEIDWGIPGAWLDD